MRNGFGLIGAGLFGERHAQAYSRHPEVDFVSVCDLNAARAKQIAETYGARRWTTDYRELLADPEIRAVGVATPDHLHCAVAVAGAEAGKHLLVEKPLATTVAEAEAIAAAANKHGVKLMVDFHNRINPPMVAARDSLLRGEVGEPVYCYARLSNSARVPTEMLSWAGQSSALWFLASHMVDLVRWMLADEPTRVYAVSRDGILKRLGITAPDVTVATVEFQRGAVAVFEHAWILPRTQPVIKDLKLEILGSEGAIYVDGSHNRALELYSAEKATWPDLLAPPTGSHLTGFVLDSIAYFVDAVVRDTPVLATGQDGIAVTRLICAILESIETRAPVELEAGGSSAGQP